MIWHKNFKERSSLQLTKSSVRHILATSAAQSNKLDEDDINAVDPFLAKLQDKTEASYIELLAKEDHTSQVPDSDDVREEEELEVF